MYPVCRFRRSPRIAPDLIGREVIASHGDNLSDENVGYFLGSPGFTLMPPAEAGLRAVRSQIREHILSKADASSATILPDILLVDNSHTDKEIVSNLIRHLDLGSSFSSSMTLVDFFRNLTLQFEEGLFGDNIFIAIVSIGKDGYEGDVMHLLHLMAKLRMRVIMTGNVSVLENVSASATSTLIPENGKIRATRTVRRKTRFSLDERHLRLNQDDPQPCIKALMGAYENKDQETREHALILLSTIINAFFEWCEFRSLPKDRKTLTEFFMVLRHEGVLSAVSDMMRTGNDRSGAFRRAGERLEGLGADLLYGPRQSLGFLESFEKFAEPVLSALTPRTRLPLL